jgi:hypothetical protein
VAVGGAADRDQRGSEDDGVDRVEPDGLAEADAKVVDHPRDGDIDEAGVDHHQGDAGAQAASPSQRSVLTGSPLPR